MAETTKISVRMDDKALEQVDSFAKSNDLNRTSTLNLFVKLATQFMQQSDAQTERFDRLEAQLMGMQRASSKMLIYLAKEKPTDQPRLDAAEAVSEKVVAKIFGEEEQSHE